ncbi:hypothetical protein B23_1709 [Geobacillus thermoleovorans B23]|nr:hypothetical protein B23_1709 [Geobacillus thermoleovorans B23]
MCVQKPFWQRPAPRLDVKQAVPFMGSGLFLIQLLLFMG